MRLTPFALAPVCAAIGLLAMAQRAEAYTVFISNEKENTISVIDSEKLEVIHTIKTGNRPRGIIMANDGKWVIVCASDDNTIQVFDAKTFEYVKDLPSGPIRAADPAHLG